VRARHAGCVRRRVAQCDLMFTLLFNNETQARAWGFITMPITMGMSTLEKNVTQYQLKKNLCLSIMLYLSSAAKGIYNTMMIQN
jgi:hypothetical protein